jgi:hypothetical protein
MKSFHKSILSLAGLICLGGALAVLPQSPALTQTLPPDVGLVTQLSGDTTYWNETCQKTPGKVQAFMKVRKGDHFKVSGGSVVQVVYFQNGRKETWKGPAAFIVGQTQGHAEGEKGIRARPEVTTLPADASEGIRRIPVLLRQARLSRLGAMQVRGTGEKPQKTFVPSKEERAEIARAKENYEKFRKQTPPDDITPELNLFGILADYEQFEEMEKIVREALKIQPDNELLKELEEWVRIQRTKSTTK